MLSNKKCVEGLGLLENYFCETKNRRILRDAAKTIQIQQSTIRLMAKRIKDEVDHFPDEYGFTTPGPSAKSWEKIYTDRAKEELNLGKTKANPKPNR